MCTMEYGAATLFLSFLCLKSLFLNKKGLLFFDFFVRLSRTCVQHSGTAVQQCRMSVPHCRTKIPIRISYFFLPTSLYFVAYASSFSSRQQREKIASQCGKRDSAAGAYIGPLCPPRNPDDRWHQAILPQIVDHSKRMERLMDLQETLHFSISIQEFHENVNVNLVLSQKYCIFATKLFLNSNAIY